jgi:hypothetical protein
MSNYLGIDEINKIAEILMENSVLTSQQAYTISAFAYSVSRLSGSLLSVAMAKIAIVINELFKLSVQHLPEEERRKIMNTAKKDVEEAFFAPKKDDDKKNGGGMLN